MNQNQNQTENIMTNSGYIYDDSLPILKNLRLQLTFASCLSIVACSNALDKVSKTEIINEQEQYDNNGN